MPLVAMADQTMVKVIFKVCLDFVCLAVLGIPVLVLYLAGKPYNRGFNCDDESIRYPFKDSTVTNTILYTYGIGIPVVTVFVVEFIRFRNAKGTLNKERFAEYGCNVYNELVVFAFGALSSQFLTDIAKYSIGRLRPHFIDICRPRKFTTLCPDTPNYAYIEEYECTQPNEKLMKEARLSFMSGHSSFSAYTMVYTAMYLQKRADWDWFGLLRPVLQVLVIYLSLYTGLSRISDYKHHWSDVFVGLIQGTTVAILTHTFVRDVIRMTTIPIKVRQDSASNSARTDTSRQSVSA